MRLADRLALGTPDITPSTTPCITPAHSPQVVRRTNPFFTGDGNQKEEGNWLFRPGPKTVILFWSYPPKFEISLPINVSSEGQRFVRSKGRDPSYWRVATSNQKMGPEAITIKGTEFLLSDFHVRKSA